MTSYNINKFAVIGAGNMGSGIAQKIATEGFRVVLVDLDDEKVARGVGIIRDMLAQGVERKVFKPAQAEAILANIEGTSDWSKLGDVDLVIEAVFENMDVKRSVFSRLSENCKPTAILGTNTSSFLVKELVDSVTNPERLVGLHYFFHPAKNRLVEVIGHEGTSDEVYRATWASQEAIGKTPIYSGDAPGFVVNRYFVPWVNEGVRLLGEGAANIATIEWAAKKAFSVGMGPFELMNVTGVPISLHAATSLGDQLGDFYYPGQALVDFCETGELNWSLDGEVDEAKFDLIAERLLGATFYVAAQLVEENVASVIETDIGARVGLRWPKGPFELLHDCGLEAARDLAAAAIAEFDLELPKMLSDLDHQAVTVESVSSCSGSASTDIWFQRPDSMNALDQQTIMLFDAKLTAAQLAQKPVILRANGKAFVAGADIKFFVDALNNNDYPSIGDFAAHGQKVFSTLSGNDHPSVCRAQGLCLGGGAELALAADWIVASPKMMIGFPETSIGIFPGLGGTQRLPRRVGLPIAKYLLYTGQLLNSKQALEIGLIDEISSFAELDACCEKWAANTSYCEKDIDDITPHQNWTEVWNFFETNTLEQILSGEADALGNPLLEKAIYKMGQKSYHALKMCEDLFHEGAPLPLKHALELESRDLQTAFDHPDALEGLSALLEGRRPQFEQVASV
ncbi:MAG: enoyl-CoA hydratase/isomerase family protein [Planctomycetes bacterium]|nr:enoyl-CoA hydratase/isomerase family protein [Planctomycetota bacterium]